MIRLEGFHKHCITLEAGEGVAAGQLVTVTDDDTAATATSGDIHEVDEHYLALCRETGLRAAECLGWTRVACTAADGTVRSQEEIHAEIWEHISRFFQD